MHLSYPFQNVRSGVNGMNSKLRRASKSPMAVFVTSLVVALIIVIAAHFGFKPIRKVEAYIRGESLMADATSKSFGVVGPGKPGSVAFALKNIGNKAVSVIGVNSSCTCTAVANDLPLMVEPGKTKDLIFTVRWAKTAGDSVEDIFVYTNSPSQSKIYLQISGQFVAD